MPSAYLIKVARNHPKLTLDDVEKRWETAKQVADKEGFKKKDGSYYAYAMGVFKKSVGINAEALEGAVQRIGARLEHLDPDNQTINHPINTLLSDPL